MKSEAGFTLVEMLVGLLVLSFTALALSAALSSAFTSFTKIRSVNQGLLETHYLKQLLSDVGRSYYYDGTESGLKGELRVKFKPDVTLVSQAGPNVLILENPQTTDETIWQSPEPIRLSVGRPHLQFIEPENRSIPLKPYLVVETLRDDVWQMKVQVPLIVSRDPGCQYDIVGRRCR